MTEPWSCLVCGQPVDLNQRTGWAQRVEGWEEVRRQGGANKIMERRVIPNQVAHVSCLRWGAPGQEKLV